MRTGTGAAWVGHEFELTSVQFPNGGKTAGLGAGTEVQHAVLALTKAVRLLR